MAGVIFGGQMVGGILLFVYAMVVDGIDTSPQLYRLAGREAQRSFIAATIVVCFALVGAALEDSTRQRADRIRADSAGEPRNELAGCGAARESCDGRS